MIVPDTCIANGVKMNNSNITTGAYIGCDYYTPFCLGLPVVDSIPHESGSYVVRSKNKAELSDKIQRLQADLSKNDLIKIYIIGFRPDYPIPVGRFFAEIYVGIGEAEGWQYGLGLWNHTLFHRIATGMRGEKDE